MKFSIKKIIMFLFIVSSTVAIATTSLLIVNNSKKDNDVIFNSTSLAICVDETFDLNSVVQNDSGKNIEWSSSDNNIIVIKNNEIFGKKAGNAFIYASIDGKQVASYEISVFYSITYELDGGTLSETNLTKYVTISEDIELVNPEKLGYVFAGWTGSGLNQKQEKVTLIAGTTGNLQFTANWEPVKYSISYQLNNGVNNQNNLDYYSVESETFILQNPTRDYYDFVEWQLNGEEVTQIAKGTTGDLELNAIWSPKNYNISYELSGGILNISNPTSYTVESNEITLINPIKNGYTFVGWTEENSITKTLLVKIPTGSFGNKKYTSNWEILTYTITYELNNGVNNPNNINSYTIENETIILQNPTRDYYDFVEWQFNGEKITEISKGSTGNYSLNAIWKEREYTISYNLNGGIVNGFNPNSYNVNSNEITLNNPTKNGYNFIGWTGTDLSSKTFSVIISTGSFGNRNYTANWEIVEYEISYNLNNGINNSLNITNYTIESDTFVLQNPTREHYNFVEWQKDGEKITEISNGSTGNITLTAIWVEKEYSISYNLNNGTTIYSNPTTYNINSDDITVVNPTKTGYEFTGWTGTDLDEKTMNLVISNGSYGNRNYTANWQVVEYSITYYLFEGTNNPNNPTLYTIESDTLTLYEPHKDNYEFIEWQLNGEKITEIQTGTNGNLEIYAVWNNSEYSISYELNGGQLTTTNPTSYNVNTETITLNNPTKFGYEFAGWTGSGLKEKTIIVTIPKGSYGNRNFVANWKAIEYSINYNLNGGTNNPNNPSFYTIETETIVLQNPIRDYYNFVEWQLDGKAVSQIEITSLKEITLTAVWTEKEYSISYDLNNGVTSLINPTSYNINSEEIIVVNPTKTGYEFVGWTGTELNEKTLNLVIPTGSFGNRNYTANWKATEYSISYESNGGVISGNNPSSYTIESENIVLINPTRIGYNFIGWTGTELNDKTLEVTISQGSIGNRSYVANWEIIHYSIQYTLNGGTNNSFNPSDYTIETETIVLQNPTRDNYNFVEWQENGVKKTNIFKGSTGNITLTAIWEEINYSITYDLDGGQISNQNPISYNVNSNDLNINNPTKTGYNFVGWTGTGLNDETMNVVIPTGSSGNRHFTANWEIIAYTISYNLNNGNLLDSNPNNYTITSNIITLNNPSRNGYTFIGWTGTDLDSMTMSVTILSGSIGDRNYTANWQAIEYSITYNLDDGINNEQNPDVYTIDTETFVLKNPTKEHYNFVEWQMNSEKVTQITKGTTGDIILNAIWVEKDYTITYNLNGGSLSENNPIKYNINSATFTLNNPTKTGYTFVGWTGSNSETPELVVTILTGSTGDKNYIANWQIDTYTINYNLNDGNISGTYKTTYSVNDSTFNLPTPTKIGYNFIGWTGSNGETPEMVVTIPTGSIGNRNYTADWQAIEYSITYNLDNGTNNEQNPDVYTIETETIVLQNPTKEHYDFVEWQKNGEKITQIVEGSTGNITLTAIWTETSYSIEYNLDGGILTESNPETYNINSNSITLNNPTKIGYIFVGWTGSNGETPEMVVTISNGSFGNKNYTANWQIETYTLNYILDNGSLPDGYKSLYTIVDETFVLPTPTKTGYTFTGWAGSNGINPQISVSIETGNTGDKTYTAHWELVTYTITYELDGGTNAENNPTKYTIETPTITLQNPSKTYFDFVEWQKDGEAITQIVKGSTGNIVLTAIWLTNCFTIDYNLDNGQNNPNNPAIYDIDSDDIILENPTKTGYNFLGWTGTDLDEITMNVTISSGSVGNRTYTAHWEIITYTITYELNGGTNNENNPAEYTVESSTIILENPNRNHYEFVEWQMNGEKITEIVTGSTGDIILTAIWDFPEELNNFEYYYDEDENLCITGLIDRTVTEIVVPDYAYSISKGAFYGTSNLTSIELPFVGSNLNLTSASSNSLFGYIFGTNSFEGATKTTQYYNSNNSINYYIPQSLKTVKITQGTLLNRVFYNCSMIENITLNDNIETLPPYIFYNCTKLSNILIPNSVTSIQEKAFYKCTSLKDIIIPNSVVSITEMCFDECTSLESITLPFVGISLNPSSDGYKTIGVIFKTKTVYGNSDGSGNEIENWTKAFYHSTSSFGTSSATKFYYIPSSLKSIKITGGEIWNNAFRGCNTLENIELPENITYIGEYAFYNCSNLTNIIIPTTVENIGQYAFYGCKLITNIIIPNNVTSIGSNAFSSCSRLIEVNNKSLLNISAGSSDFGYIGYYAKRIYSEGISYISKDNDGFITFNDGNNIYLVNYVGSETEITLPNYITIINHYALMNNNHLTNVVISDNVTSIEKYAFYCCTNLLSIEIPNSVLTIEECTFSFCENLTNLKLGNNVTNIGDNAFMVCKKLNNIKIPNSVITIGKNAFGDCTSLNNVIFENKNGWRVSEKGNFSNSTYYTSISSSNISSSYASATYLTSTYRYYYWKRV